MVEEYRDYRRQQPLKWHPERITKGATVNRELECLQCMFQFAVSRKYIPENPASEVRHFDERRERPIKRMLTVEEERRILGATTRMGKKLIPVTALRKKSLLWAL